MLSDERGTDGQLLIAPSSIARLFAFALLGGTVSLLLLIGGFILGSSPLLTIIPFTRRLLPAAEVMLLSVARKRGGVRYIQAVRAAWESPRKTRTHIMDPFVTTKVVGKGTGLGLSISRSIELEHEGTLEPDQSPSHTCFVMKLPLSAGT